MASEELQCTVCFDPLVPCMSFPCHHKVCGVCAPFLNACPVCRQPGTATKDHMMTSLIEQRLREEQQQQLASSSASNRNNTNVGANPTPTVHIVWDFDDMAQWDARDVGRLYLAVKTKLGEEGGIQLPSGQTATAFGNPAAFADDNKLSILQNLCINIKRVNNESTATTIHREVRQMSSQGAAAVFVLMAIDPDYSTLANELQERGHRIFFVCRNPGGSNVRSNVLSWNIDELHRQEHPPVRNVAPQQTTPAQIQPPAAATRPTVTTGPLNAAPSIQDDHRAPHEQTPLTGTTRRRNREALPSPKLGCCTHLLRGILVCVNTILLLASAGGVLGSRLLMEHESTTILGFSPLFWPIAYTLMSASGLMLLFSVIAIWALTKRRSCPLTIYLMYVTLFMLSAFAFGQLIVMIHDGKLKPTLDTAWKHQTESDPDRVCTFMIKEQCSGFDARCSNSTWVNGRVELSPTAWCPPCSGHDAAVISNTTETCYEKLVHDQLEEWYWPLFIAAFSVAGLALISTVGTCHVRAAFSHAMDDDYYENLV